MASDIAGPIMMQCVLVFTNAFFAMSEIALLSVNENKIRSQANAGDKKAEGILKLIEQPSNFLATIQVGITLAGFLASAFAANEFSTLLVSFLQSIGVTWNAVTLHRISIVAITIVLSFFMLVLGELVPKRIAMNKADSIARVVMPPLRVLGALTRPVVWLLTKCTNLILRLLGINPNSTEDAVTEEEIRMMVDLGEEKGVIDADEQRLIENVFEFDKKQVEEIMCHRMDIEAVSLEDTDMEILTLFKESGYSRMPVYDEDIDHIIGILHARDFLANHIEENPKPLMDIIRTCLFVPETLRIDSLFNQMQQKRIHIAIALDEHGGTSGLITLEDVLEELVGNIFDEFDDLEDAEIQGLSDGNWRMVGSVSLDDVNECLLLNIPTEDYDTLAGFIYDMLETIPEDGTHPEFEYKGYRFVVAEIDDRRIEWVEISKIVPMEPIESGKKSSEKE